MKANSYEPCEQHYILLQVLFYRYYLIFVYILREKFVSE